MPQQLLRTKTKMKVCVLRKYGYTKKMLLNVEPALSLCLQHNVIH